MSKYAPLYLYLKAIPPETRDITLTFSQIEGILNDDLPASALKHQEWWANETYSTHTQAENWIGACWRVESVDLTNRSVRFLRQN